MRRASLRGRDCLEWAAALLLAGIFLAAAIPKIADPGAFAAAVDRYRLVPAPAVNLVAIYLPWFELGAALALAFLPSARRGSFAALIGLLGMFTVAMVFAILRGSIIPCGCFSDGSAVGWGTLLRNASLILVGLCGFAACTRPGSRG